MTRRSVLRCAAALAALVTAACAAPDGAAAYDDALAARALGADALSDDGAAPRAGEASVGGGGAAAAQPELARGGGPTRPSDELTRGGGPTRASDELALGGGFADLGATPQALEKSLDKAALQPMSRSQIIANAQSAMGYSYWWGGGRWDPSSKAYPGRCSPWSAGGGCPSCSHSATGGGPEYGADCSGLVGTVWQVPAPVDMRRAGHPYTTWSFQGQSSYWSRVSWADLEPGDALVYNSGGAGHIVVFERWTSAGNAMVYECRGCSYGCVHRVKAMASNYVGIRRAQIQSGGSSGGGSGGSSTPSSPAGVGEGALERISCTAGVTGWARDAGAPDEAVKIHFYVDGVPGQAAAHFTAMANAPRGGACTIPESPSTRQVQAQLVKLGFDLGRWGSARNGVDGIYGKDTTRGMRAFQRTQGLADTGRPDDATVRALFGSSCGCQVPSNPSTTQIQRRLVSLGFDLGAWGPRRDGVDGDYGKDTTAGMRAFQRSRKLAATGRPSRATLAALFGTGCNHGFQVDLPAALRKDGKAHVLRAYAEDANGTRRTTPLAGSPKSFSCAADTGAPLDCSYDADCTGGKVCAWNGTGYCCRAGGQSGALCMSDRECSGGDVCAWNGANFVCAAPRCGG